MVSLFANDFGDFQRALEGEGDWEEGSYWLGLIRAYCYARDLEYLVVPAPWVNQVSGPQMSGNYPGKIANHLGADGSEYLDPMVDFANAQLEIVNRSSAWACLRPVTHSSMAGLATATSRHGGAKSGLPRWADDWLSRSKSMTSRSR